MKHIHLKSRWVEIFVRLGRAEGSGRIEFQWYRVAPRQRMPEMRERLAKRLAMSFKETMNPR